MLAVFFFLTTKVKCHSNLSSVKPRCRNNTQCMMVYLVACQPRMRKHRDGYIWAKTEELSWKSPTADPSSASIPYSVYVTFYKVKTLLESERLKARVHANALWKDLVEMAYLSCLASDPWPIPAVCVCSEEQFSMDSPLVSAKEYA